MTTKLHTGFFVMVLLVIAGCQDSFTDLGEESRSARVASYPLHLGNRWVYERIAYFHNIRSNDTSIAIPRDTMLSSVTVEVIGYAQLPRQPQTIGDSITAVMIEQTASETTPFSYRLQGIQYMTQDAHALWLHGYVAAAAPALPKRNQNLIQFTFRGRTFSSIQELSLLEEEGPAHPPADSVVREIPPLMALRLPLAEGNRWTFRPIGHPWRIDKQVGGVHRDTVAGKQISASEVLWLYDMDGDGMWDDDIRVVDLISNQGLVRRSTDVKDIVITTTAEPNPVGLADYTERIIAVELKATM